MASFRDYLTPSDAEDVRAFVAQEAAALKTREDAAPPKPY
jgi:hypothetical protein